MCHLTFLISVSGVIKNKKTRGETLELISKRNSMTHTNEKHNYKDPIRIPNGITNIERNDTFKSSHKHPKANMRCIIPKGPCPRINHKRKHPKIILHSNIYPINE